MQIFSIYILGFKATQVHKRCVIDRNITLVEVFGADYESSPDLPINVKTLLDTEKGNATYTITVADVGEVGSTITFPNCNLEEELDNVSEDCNFIIMACF